jgi:hypothetical protein
MKIIPTIGRIVWINRPQTNDPKQAEPAIVCYVHEGPGIEEGRFINVAGFDHEGKPFRILELYLVQEGESKPADVPFACWMPYQQAQAKKYPDTKLPA